ncbi:uncharacterized protein RCC_07956 [Ramularia collo-cygni]|uniref:N-acetylglucosamine-induced protein 1 n=1 Tax=Ramularia collo-cygni TaxID=112498 RepID=A0A2D3VBB2_9PEZI|nr:uncharacterized protein RCC_07956 [Ramularia collo-cygni]CZT22087.1 uncharacterized protein RCC_07956 [Ramularia collo-cygni]
MTSSNDVVPPETRPSQTRPLNTLWWNTNLPKHLQTPTCPAYLQYAFDNAKDRAVLSTPDALYRRQTWPEVQELIRQNRLQDFTRVPSELRAYREFCSDIEQGYGSILNFILKERLRWELESADADGRMSFDDAKATYRILRNDWPYGFDPRIVHLVVWTKFALPIDPDSEIGDMSSAARKVVDDFVGKTFSEVSEKVWFKNWGALKSVHAVEHFHVLLFNPGEKLVERVTG